jgi:hypothetical protein
MKRLLFVFLMMTCSVSWAEWEILSGAANGLYIEYYDKSTIRKNGEIVKMWTMLEFSEVQTSSAGKSFQSSKALKAFNCKSEEGVLISYIFFSGSMGQGNVVVSETLKEKIWDPISPGSMAESEWSIACGKK